MTIMFCSMLAQRKFLRSLNNLKPHSDVVLINGYSLYTQNIFKKVRLPKHDY